ncbi:ATP-binding protein [Desulfobacula sp.]|uniref:ATP-binding protein n=1 Tax=Desulfobacula sp. TaxID=2593537 RepID=UPI0026053DEB|nr:ATP-binding protein [Desulfobacula sp.]
MKRNLTIRMRLFILFSIIFIASMIFLTYAATQIVTQFGAYSAVENEVSIKSQASFFLSQVTREKALRYENIFKRIAVSSAYLAQQSSMALGMEDILGEVPRNTSDRLIKSPRSRLYSNHPTDPVMVLYWGEKKPDAGIVRQLNTLSHMDPLLKTISGENSEAAACFITLETAITRYYPNFTSIIRNLSESAYEIRDTAWYRAVKPKNNPDRKTRWSEVYQDPAGRGLMTTAVTPVYSRGQDFIGATGVDVTLTDITDKILADTKNKDLMQTKGLFSFIVDDGGRIIAFPRAYLAMFGFERVTKLKNIQYNALFNLRLSDSESPSVRQLWTDSSATTAPRQHRILIDDQQLLISSFIMPSTGWRLGVAVPESNLLESVQETRHALKSMVNTMMFKFAFFALMVMVISIVGFTLLSFKYFIRPLDTLIKAAVSVKEGDLTQQVPVEREDEIGILAHTFNGMVAELKKLNIKEKDHSRQLQRKVRERTVELEEKSRQQDNTLTQLQLEIRERKQIQHQLIKSEEKYRDIFNNSVQGIFQSSRDNRLLSVNPSLVRMMGYTSIEDFLSKIQNLSEQVYVDPTQRERFLELLRENDFVSGFETQLRKKDGSRLWVSICGRGIKDTDGNLVQIQGSFEDISARKQAEEIFKQAKKMAEDASLAKSEFLTIMSHELRTPLNAIIGMTRLTLSTHLDDAQKDYLDAVLISSDHLLTLLNSILDFSKIEAGKFVLDQKPFDMDALLNDLMVMFSFQAEKKQLDLTYSTGGIPGYVKGDSHRLRQILVNIVGNAIKFTNEGSINITVDVEDEDCRRSSPDEVVLLFSITDTGIGIPADKFTAVFNDFTQLSSAHGTASGGTGLGLAITKQLIHLMGGDIWVESQEGKGSTFYFKIRLIKASSEEGDTLSKRALPPPALPKGNAVYTPLKILLAEDFEVNRKLIIPFLEQHGHTVVIAENGQAVLDLLSGQAFDLILMDIKMPVMDGIETTRHIRAHQQPEISMIPIIALTAHAIKGDREIFLAAGMDDYVSKPINGDDLLIKLEQLSNGRRPITKMPEKPRSCNLEYALKLMGNNQDIVMEICKTIILKFPEEIEKIKKAILNKDFDTIVMTSHSLKSGAKSIDANRFLHQIESMEAAGKAKDLQSAQALCTGLISVTDEVIRDLKQMMA